MTRCVFGPTLNTQDEIFIARILQAEHIQQLRELAIMNWVHDTKKVRV